MPTSKSEYDEDLHREAPLTRSPGILFRLALAMAIVLATAWASLALWYRLPTPEPMRELAAGVFALIGLSAIIALFGRRRILVLIGFAIAFAAVSVWWTTLKPATDADWATDVARQVTGEIDGDILTLTNVRVFDWRSESDFVERWTSRSYDLSKLRTLDLFMSYWAGPEMAHVILSFGFDGGGYLAWSIEVRRRIGGEFSPIADLFKSNPLIIIATEESDVVRVRSNFRKEDVQLYRLKVAPEQARLLLLEYVADANALARTPAFYNSISTNCTTTIIKMMRAVGDSMPLDWRYIANGYLPEYAYERGVLDTRLPLAQLRELAHIDKRAQEAGASPRFSELIRVGVPSPGYPRAP
jgi:Domain of unknown function (DUF4105)